MDIFVIMFNEIWKQLSLILINQKKIPEKNWWYIRKTGIPVFTGKFHLYIFIRDSSPYYGIKT